MLRNLRTAVKFFAYGLALGLLFAPRSGAETSKQLLSWITGTLKETAGSISGSNHD